TITQHLAMEYAKDGIRVNAVAPGAVSTPLHRNTPQDVMESLSPMGRPSTVKDIADAVLYLTDAATVTGDILYVDGGAHRGRWSGKGAFVEGSAGTQEGGHMAITRGKVLSVNVGLPRGFEYNGRPARSAIWKSPVAGRVAARGINLAGGDQADRRAHGGPDKAVYAYAVEDLGWWAQEVGRPLQYGELGENLTTEGIDVNGALVGER